MSEQRSMETGKEKANRERQPGRGHPTCKWKHKHPFPSPEEKEEEGRVQAEPTVFLVLFFLKQEEDRFGNQKIRAMTLFNLSEHWYPCL